MYIGGYAGSYSNSVVVSSGGSVASIYTDIGAGQGSSNSLIISNGGTMTTPCVDIGDQSFSSNNSLLVSGAGSTLTRVQNLNVGNDGSGNNLLISNAGVVLSSNGVIGNGTNSFNNSALVTGSNSLWSNSGTLTVGNYGSGTVTVANGGSLSASQIILGAQNGSSGTLNIGSLGGNDSAGNVTAGFIQLGTESVYSTWIDNKKRIITTNSLASGSLNFNQTNTTKITSLITSSYYGDSGKINQLGSGTTILTGSQNGRWTTTITNGALQIGDGVTSGASVNWGNITNNASLIFAPSAADTYGVYSWISGSGSVTHIGSGTTVLNSYNSYTGPTVINSGTLEVDGRLASAGSVTVNSGGILSGAGSIGNVTINRGGTIAAVSLNSGATDNNGNLIISPSNLTLQSALWAPGGNYNWMLNNGSGVNSSGTLGLTINSTLDLSQLSATNQFNLNLASGGWGFMSILPQSWTIASVLGGITNFSPSDFAINTEPTNRSAGLTRPLNGFFAVTTNSSGLELTYAPVYSNSIAQAYLSVAYPGASWTSITGANNSLIWGLYSMPGSSSSPQAFIYDGNNYNTISFIGYDGTPVQSVSIVGASGLSMILGNYVASDNSTHGFVYDGQNFNTFDVPKYAYYTNVWVYPEGTTNYYTNYFDPQTTLGGIAGNMIWGNCSDQNNNNQGFLYDGTNFNHLSFPISDGVPGDPMTPADATDIKGISGNTSWGHYQTYNCQGFEETHAYIFDGQSYTKVEYPGVTRVAYNPEMGDYSLWSGYSTVDGISGSIVWGHYSNSKGVTNYFLFDGQNYTPVYYPASISTTVLGIVNGVVMGSFSDPVGQTHSFAFSNGHYSVIKNSTGIESWSSGVYAGRLWGGYYDNDWQSRVSDYNGTSFASVNYPGSNDSWFNGGSLSGSKVWGGYTDSNGVAQAFVYDYRYDTPAVPPVITLNGANPMNLVYGTSFIDPGAIVVDPVDGTNSLSGNGSVDPTTPGTYTLTYGYTNSRGTIASTVTRKVTVTPASQTITFPALGSVAVGSGPVIPGATASSGLAITYTSSVANVASVSGSTLTILGAGTTTITASQSGNVDYLAATPVSQVLVVTNFPVTNPPVTNPLVTNPPSTNSSNPPSWTPPTGLRYSALVYAKVLDENGNPITAYGSKLAAFNGSSIAGVATPFAGPGGTTLFYLNVFANQSSVSGMTYQVYNAATGVTSTLDETYNFSSGVTTGTIVNPIVLHIVRKQLIPVYAGWTWISFNVLPADNTWGTLLSNYQGADNDVIIGAGGSATYYGGHWYPSSPDFTPQAGVMYLISSGTATNVTATGYPAPTPVNFSLVNGWNWLGCPDASATTLTAMLSGVSFNNNDLIISQTGQSATYYGGIWYTSTGSSAFPMAPGTGYLLYINGRAQTVTLQ